MNNVLDSIFPTFAIFVHKQSSKQQLKGLYTHKSYFCNKLKEAISEEKRVLHCEGYYYEDFPVEIGEAPLSDKRLSYKANESAQENRWIHVVW